MVIMMFKASTWIGRNALKKLSKVVRNYDSDIADSIDDYLSVNNHGEYLMNILTSEEIRRLQNLEKDWDLNMAMRCV